MIEHFRQLPRGAKVIIILLFVVFVMLIIATILKKPTSKTQTLLPPSLTSLNLKSEGNDPSAYRGSSVHFLSYYNNYLYYLSDGYSTFYKVSLDGKDKLAISDPLIAKIDDVVWSPDKTSAILTIENDKYFLGKNHSPFFVPNDNSDTTVWYYNFQNEQFKQLSSDIGPATFSPDSSHLAYFKTALLKDPGLYISSADGSNETLLAQPSSLPYQTNLTYLGSSNLVSYTDPSGYGQNYVYETDITTKQTIKLNSDGMTFGNTASPNGDKIITTTVKQQDIVYTPYLSVIDVPTKRLKILDQLSAPSPVSAWSPDGSRFFVIDNNMLSSYDSETYQKQSAPLPSSAIGLKIDGGSLIIMPDNKTAYFTADGTLYKMVL